MNRRGFISNLILACTAPRLLLRAEPDGFKWNLKRELLVPEPGEMVLDPKQFYGTWQFVTDRRIETTFESFIALSRPEFIKIILHKR